LRLTQPVRYPFNRRLYGFLCWFKGCGQKAEQSHYMPSTHRGEWNNSRALTILEPGARSGWVVSATPQPLYPGKDRR